MLEYCHGLIASVLWQLWNLFGVVSLLAWLLQLLGDRIRSHGVSRFGAVYWYFVAPGVACHETGHALGCILTGVKITKFVPFCRKDGLLGYVQHVSPMGWFGPIASFVISTGPIWFGSAVILLLTRVFADATPQLSWRECFGSATIPGTFEYGWRVLMAGGGFLAGVFGGGHWGVGFIIWLYLSFCIASEIGLSSVDLKHMWPGVVMFAGAVVALNVIPAVGRGLSMAVYVMMPWIFKVHVLMLAALIINLTLYVVFKRW